MKATLEFTLPEEREEFEIAQKGIRYYCALLEFSEWLRREIKHNGDLHNDLTSLERVREMFHEITRDVLE